MRHARTNGVPINRERSCCSFNCVICYKSMATFTIIACCIVIPLGLLSIPLINSRRAKKRKTQEEQEKIRAYGNAINEETRNKYK